jgi:hypothetical protein
MLLFDHIFDVPHKANKYGTQNSSEIAISNKTNIIHEHVVLIKYMLNTHTG